MTKFTYIATNDQGKTIKGAVESESRPEAIGSIQAQGLTLLSIKEEKPKKQLNFSFSIGKSNTKVKNDDLVMFTRQMSAMVGAGVPIMRSLESQRNNTRSNGLKQALAGIISDVEAGSPLADALEKFPTIFNDVYTNMVRAGEAAGILDEILSRLALQQEKNATMRKKIKSAMTYPIVLLSITIVAFFGLMIFVIPRIGDIVKDLGGPDAELPALTRFMLSLSDFVIHSGIFLVPIIAVLVFIFLRWARTATGKQITHRLILKTPLLKTIVQKIIIARFARTFSSLMGAGVAVLEALHVTARAVGNVIYEEALHQAADKVKEGQPLSSIIGQNDLFPPIVAQMLAVGEETGQTDKVIVKVADFYEDEVDISINGLSSIIEPAMIVVMGSMVGLIAASVMGPIAGLAQNVKG